MNQTFQSTATIRQRGQLTIPDSIRTVTDWVRPGSVVSVSQFNDQEIVIRPHGLSKKEVDWEKLWRNIELARSFKGKYTGSLSNFIIEDRNNH